MHFGDGRELDKFEIAMEATGLAWWWMELPSGAVFFSPNKAQMIGRNPADFMHYKDFTDLVHPDDYEKAMQAMRDHLEGKKELYETTYRIKHQDGSYVQFYDRGQIVGREEGKIVLAGFVFDVVKFDTSAVTEARTNVTAS
ncbi:MAG TPA: PAS domain-containing protein [Candidatus Saccharimonadales bacterium]|nr:PAS domain-containing protein [Candidatus Saccharimonadales bacterium]